MCRSEGRKSTAVGRKGGAGWSVGKGRGDEIGYISLHEMTSWDAQGWRCCNRRKGSELVPPYPTSVGTNNRAPGISVLMALPAPAKQKGLSFKPLFIYSLAVIYFWFMR